jgi:HPt (histidine-containing phosphotransfer) domain-containing protein
MTTNIDIPFEARQLYITRRQNDLSECLKAIESDDFSFFKKIGHQIKGNATTFGFDELAPIAIAMEQAATQQDKIKLRGILNEFRLFLDGLPKEFQS